MTEENIKIKVKDILLVGSNCSYNYTDKSDLDIHIITDTDSLECPDDLYPKLYSAYRSLFNSKLDINFYGIPVELYVETEENSRVSNGCYSVMNDEWVTTPDINAIPEVNQEEVDKAVAPWEEKYTKLVNEITADANIAFEAIAGLPDIEDNKTNWVDFGAALEALDCMYDDDDPYLVEEVKSVEIDKIDKYIEDLYDLRKKSLAEEGEYGLGNLVFKEMRNKGYLDNLKDLKNKLIGKELCLEAVSNKSLQEIFGFGKKKTVSLDQLQGTLEKFCPNNWMFRLDKTGKLSITPATKNFIDLGNGTGKMQYSGDEEEAKKLIAELKKMPGNISAELSDRHIYTEIVAQFAVDDEANDKSKKTKTA